MNLRLEILFLCAAAAVWVAQAAGDELLPTSDECGVLRSEQFHNHSSTTQINEFPWTCYIVMNSVIERACVGALISSRYVVTVAHCVDDVGENMTSLKVVFGGWHKSNRYNDQDCDHHGRCSTPLRVDLNRVVIHPDYNGILLTNDIALLRLREVVTFNDYIRPICLPGAEVARREFGSDQLTLAGWLAGWREDQIKMKIHTVVNNKLDCERKYGDNYLMSETKLCAIACIDVGNSFLAGSPLMDFAKNSQGNDYYYLVGLLSYGRLCDFPAYSDVFVRVDSYHSWIVENML